MKITFSTLGLSKPLSGTALMMIGTKHLIAGADSLQFKIGRNAGRWSGIKIRLNGLDLYDFTFFRIRKMRVTAEQKHDNVYCDQMLETIRSETGMATSL